MLKGLLLYVQRLNLFSSRLTSTNEYELRNERISTRLFVIILLLLIMVILIYTGQVRISERIEVVRPLYNDLKRLSIVHSETLQCLCDNVAIRHESFVHLVPSFHQLCSSELIGEDWIDRTRISSISYISDDFSYTASRFFVTLSSLCRLSNETVMNALDTFKSSRLITLEMLNENVFVEHVETMIKTFQSLMEFNFYQSFDFIEYSSETNSFLSALFSNIVVSIDLNTYYVSNLVRVYENKSCHCDITSSCVDPMTLSNSTIPGLFKGCFFVQAVRQSTLECFYDSSCLSTIEQLLNISPKSISSLNISLKSRFNRLSTIDEFLSKVMTEEWLMNISHEKYFNECKVSACYYLLTSRLNVIYMITTLIGLIGGLTKILRVLIPPLVRFVRRRFVPPPSLINDNRK